MAEEPYSYDEVPYASHPFPQTHPDRLATIATLFGMQPQAVEQCRVLELGCAAGGNLTPMAVTHPASRFVGVDLSRREIDEGQRIIRALRLENIELLHRDIQDLGDELGPFDYVICHGVYSWVPPAVREKILDLCARLLRPQGVAYVSYNTYPGWHLRQSVREMMRCHVRKYSSPQDRVKHARALLDLLVKAVPTENDPYGLLLKSELGLLAHTTDSYVFHEHLEKVNEPVYFYQFDAHARSKGLQFLAEAELSAMSLRRLPTAIAAVLHDLTENYEEMEQYLDFLSNRMFRQTLLCHQKVALDRRLSPDRLHGLYVASPMRLEESSSDSDLLRHSSPTHGVSPVPQTPSEPPVPCELPARFVGQGGSICTTDPLLKEALTALGAAWPAAIAFDTLTALLHSRMGQDTAASIASRLGASLLDCYVRGFVELHANAPPWCATPGERPKVTALARLQAERGRFVTNLKHQRVELNEVGRLVVRLADGSRSRSELLHALMELASRGQLVAHADAARTQDEARATPILADSLEQDLTGLAHDALLLKQER